MNPPSVELDIVFHLGKIDPPPMLHYALIFIAIVCIWIGVSKLCYRLLEYTILEFDPYDRQREEEWQSMWWLAVIMSVLIVPVVTLYVWATYHAIKELRRKR